MKITLNELRRIIREESSRGWGSKRRKGKDPAQYDANREINRDADWAVDQLKSKGGMYDDLNDRGNQRTRFNKLSRQVDMPSHPNRGLPGHDDGCKNCGMKVSLLPNGKCEDCDFMNNESRSWDGYEPRSLSDGDETCELCGCEDVSLTPNGLCDDCDDAENGLTEAKETETTIEATEEEIDKRISSMDADTIVDKDYIDSHTGEVYLEIGDRAGDSQFHPSYVPKTYRGESPVDVSFDDDDFPDYEEEDHESNLVYDTFVSQVDKFVADLDLSEHGAGPEDTAPEYARVFLHMHPEWNDNKKLGMSRRQIIDYIANLAFEKYGNR